MLGHDFRVYLSAVRNSTSRKPLGAVMNRYVVPVGFALAMAWVAVVFYLAGTSTP